MAAMVALPLPCFAQGMLLTLLDGEALVIDGDKRLAAVAGLHLAPAAIVETGANTAITRVEWPDHTAVDLGPGTRAMLAPAGFPARSGRLPLVYLLQGWAKVTGPGKVPAGGVLTPAIEVLPFAGAAVIVADRQERFVFAESGPLEVLDRGAAGARRGLATGSLYTAAGVLPRPTPGWLSSVPRAFRDPIPLRAALFKDRVVSASVLPDPTYVTLADWLSAEAAVRRDFPHRFATLVRDAASRRALQAHLSSHPEWASVLNPSR